MLETALELNGPIVHVIGARPNFPKFEPVHRALAHANAPQMVVHTGQHYDEAMSTVFFRDLTMPEPDRFLGVGSGSHAQQTAAVMVAVEDLLLQVNPAIVVVYGDINSTLGSALAAAKLQIPIAHVEAGLRSFDSTMPEELNRRLTDALANLAFATSSDAVENLVREGVDPTQIHLVGNTMIDTLERLRPSIEVPLNDSESPFDSQEYGVVTLHRPGNVDDIKLVRVIASRLLEVSELTPLVFPVHPRGRVLLEEAGLKASSRLKLLQPLGYVDFLRLVCHARLVLTDSGGIQEETSVLGIPCLTARPNTERPITLTLGTNTLVSWEAVVSVVSQVLSQSKPLPASIPLWDGQAGERVANVLLSSLK